MSLLKYTINIIVVCILLISCNSQNKDNNQGLEEIEENTYNFIKSKKQLTFDIGDRLSNRSTNIYPFTLKNGKELLYYQNGYSNTILVFDIENSKIIDTIQISQKGPNGVGDMYGFEVISQDSIFITSKFINKIFIVNSNAEVIKTIDYLKYKRKEKDKGEIYTIHTKSGSGKRLHLDKSKIYGSYYFAYGKNHYKEVAPEDVRFIAIIDQATKQIERVNVGLPKDFYTDGQYYPYFHSFFNFQSNFYVGFYSDDRILKSPDTKNWTTHRVTSRYADVKKIIKNGKSAHHIRLVPDPYRDVLYRFVIHEQENTKELTKTRIELIRDPETFSIMILDKDLNVLGETEKFPSHIYSPHGYFISKDGLYLSKSNVFNPDYDENTLDFQLFKLTKDEE